MKNTNKALVKSGSTLSYLDVGQGLPVILIHGLFLDHTAFDEQIQALVDRHRIIAIDIHGHGGSSELDRSMSLDEMAEDYSRDIHKKISNSTFVEILQCGHSSPVEQPEKITQLLEQLLLEIDRR